MTNLIKTESLVSSERVAIDSTAKNAEQFTKEMALALINFVQRNRKSLSIVADVDSALQNAFSIYMRHVGIVDARWNYSEKSERVVRRWAGPGMTDDEKSALGVSS